MMMNDLLCLYFDCIPAMLYISILLGSLDVAWLYNLRVRSNYLVGAQLVLFKVHSTSTSSPANRRNVEMQSVNCRLALINEPIASITLSYLNDHALRPQPSSSSTPKTNTYVVQHKARHCSGSRLCHVWTKSRSLGIISALV